ncbi:MAG: DNA-protecting protein DprA [Firmicutes bacterium]|nr:DNA-protecting protein DprA [Bacillota bacterium]
MEETTIRHEQLYLNALNRLPSLGARRITALMAHYGSAAQVWQNSGQEYAQILSLKTEVGEQLAEDKEALDPEFEWSRLEQYNIKTLSIEAVDYPWLLRQIPHPPPILYYRGCLEGLSGSAVAIVGSRRSTFYGQEVAGRLSKELASAGIAVVSGMALGVDTAAHRGALEGGGKTAAVLGCGLDFCYPPQNRKLMEEIVLAGVIFSEFPLGTQPLAANFPQRNRIISGLTLGTVVVEATAKSGSLITANFALEQNREVFAVPGNIGSPYSRGCHRLIKEGARLVESAADILAELNLAESLEEQLSLPLPAPELSDDENMLLRLIPYYPIQIDDLIRSGAFSAASTSSLLLSLELKKLIRQTPGKYFCRI